MNALSQLYKLASNPESAADALKLLHELQVHQVELDLQQEQMEISQHEIAEELACYKGLYDFAAVGYFSIGSQGDVIDGNLCGAELLGVGQNELRGHRIDSFLAPESRLVLQALLKRLRGGAPRAACEVKSGGDGGVARRLQVVAASRPAVRLF